MINLKKKIRIICGCDKCGLEMRREEIEFLRQNSGMIWLCDECLKKTPDWSGKSAYEGWKQPILNHSQICD